MKFDADALRELGMVLNLPNIYRFQHKFRQVSEPFRELYKNTPHKPKWMDTYDIAEQYEGLRDETIKRKMAIPSADKIELVMLLKIALFELGSHLNTRWYSSIPPDLFYYVLDRRIARTAAEVR